MKTRIHFLFPGLYAVLALSFACSVSVQTAWARKHVFTLKATAAAGPVTKANNGQVVTSTYDPGGPMSLGSHSIDGYGTITHQKTAGTGAVEQVSTDSLAPDSFFTAILNSTSGKTTFHRKGAVL